MNQPGHTTALHERLIDFKSGDMDAREAIIEHTCERLRLRTRQMLRAFGRVYKAFDPELARHVAVKVPNRHGETNGQVDSLVDEARRVAKLRHPGIVSVHDVGNDDGHCFIVSELIEGKNLSEVIASDRPNVKEAVLLVAEIAENLEAAHKAGFVHRDIKPANILIDENGKPLITDFGIASTHDAIGGMATKGTLPYMAPEQIANEPQLIDQRSDIYSLGVVLYEMLTGESPYSARTPGTLREQILFRSPKPIPDSVLPSVKKVSLKSLSKHPADRFESAEELAVALRNSLTDRPARNQTIPWRSLAIIGCIATALALAFFAGKASNQLDSDQTNVASTVIGSDNFVFDGMSRIVTPLDRFAPVTIEAWVRPDSYRNELQMIVGSDIAGQFGIGMGLSPPLLSAEVIPPNGEQGLIYADGSLASVPVQAWSHVAVVFADTETRLYLNGRLSGTGMATQPEGGSNFVIGNIGETGHMYFFNGRMKSIRISKGERFQDSFVPDDTFKADGQNFGTPAVVIYDASRQQKVEQITDYSGEGNHGAWQSLSSESSEPTAIAVVNAQDREVANMFLEFGGEIEILESNGRRRILDAREIPTSDFYLTEVKLLSNAEFNDSHLEKLRGLRRLESLYLSGSSITDDGLSAIQSMKTLRQVGLGNSAITNRGVAMLTDLPRLTFLNISNTKINDGVLDSLNKMKNLRQFLVPATPGLTEEAVREFKDANPDCLVKFSH